MSVACVAQQVGAAAACIPLGTPARVCLVHTPRANQGAVPDQRALVRTCALPLGTAVSQDSRLLSCLAVSPTFFCRRHATACRARQEYKRVGL